MIERKMVLRRRLNDATARLSFLLPSLVFSPKSYGGELPKHSKENVARCQVLQALPACQLQGQEDSEGKTKGKGEPRVEQVSVSYQSQGDDSEENR